MNELLTSIVHRITPLCQALFRAPRGSLSLTIDYHVIGEDAAREDGNAVLAWIHLRHRKWYERRIPSEECAP
jgi:hypothetical protein